jgi:hypothetical protein
LTVDEAEVKQEHTQQKKKRRGEKTEDRYFLLVPTGVPAIDLSGARGEESII